MPAEKTPATKEAKAARPMTIAEYARAHGISTQALYKRLARQGIDPASLRAGKAEKKSARRLTDKGIEILDQAMQSDGQTINQQPSTINHEASTVNHQPSTHDGGEDVDKLRDMIAAVQRDLIDATHRAEMAEARAEAATNERDYLRQQLDNAIKASVLASVQRIAAPEGDDQPVKSEPASPRSLRQRWRDAIAAWKGKP